MKHVRAYLAKLAQDDRELQAGTAALDSVWNRESIATIRALLRSCAAALQNGSRTSSGGTNS